MDFAHWLVLMSTAITLYVLGGIWFAQIVVYPLFAKVGGTEYVAYHRYYSSRIPFPVILPGFASFLLPIALLFVRPESVSLLLVAANAVCATVGLLVTVALEIPRHRRLARTGKEDHVIRELVAYNWPRTLSISGCALLSLAMLVEAFVPN